MISNFFVLSPRGDTILAKQYRSSSGTAAHERSHTEALFRKIKFWDDMAAKEETAVVTTTDSADPQQRQEQQQQQQSSQTRTGDAPPVLLMPDGLTYFHVRRNGLIFGASSARNVSPHSVVEVRQDSKSKTKLVLDRRGDGLFLLVLFFLSSCVLHSSYAFCQLFQSNTISSPIKLCA